MKFKRSIILIAALFVLPACGIGSFNESIDLNGTSWILISYDGISPIEGKVMTANFEKGEINGSASCNHYFGSYRINGSQMSIEGLGWTEMACLDPEGIMEQEQIIMRILNEAESISLQGDNLNIRSKSGEILLFTPLVQ
jgi:heat shock protein HslJ